ncbi:sirohydrochlorin chelatase [Pseudoneobacillus rhizosphaerae]|uniref:Sirohydrochlorin ferrochelatase n=1 Tax=Pseudoneobacillus rhizosphaerae TaxID=2880968 RepID=A0A9C7G687_9BACI|nr:sirohydrochlorin chelatase [Pseudoneobacillus rhizosphaerae]CAG9606493.1 Sirohydrochlorin ferrochelatase [Pseudoneobacillus rhizosphaerae]
MEAVVFIGHGSRTPIGNEEFIQFIQSLLEKIDVSIKGYGFLEKAEPSIFQAISNAIEAGATKVTVIPVLLLSGVHANRDIPNELLIVKELYPSVSIRYGEPIGIDNQMVEIIQDRLIAKGHVEEDIIIIGHGSRVPAAAEQLQQIVSMLEKVNPVKIELAYITTAPYYQEVLKYKNRKTFIVPYLLFTGGYINQIKEKVGNGQLCNPIGFDQKLYSILLKRVQLARVI